MNLFRYAGDYYGDALAQQLLFPAALLFLLLAVFFAGIHALRRSAGQPRSTEPVSAPLFTGEVERYEIGARLYHWGNAAIVAALVASGYALFAPGAIKPTLIAWLRVHELSAAAFIAGVVFHAIVAPVKGEGRTMWFERRDRRDLRTIIANFCGRTRQYPAFGKYDPFQKMNHAAIALLSLCIIVSGVVLTVSAEVWSTVPRDLLRWMRLVHDLAAVWLVSLLIGHAYFGVIRVNRPALWAIITGRISSAYLSLYHSPQRWLPHGKTRQATGD